MNTPTFDDAVAAAQQDHHEVAAIKHLFVEPIKALTALRAQWAKQYPSFCDRSRRVRQRAEQAMQAGVEAEVVYRFLNPMLRELEGGGDSLFPGQLHTIAGQIESGIAAMSRFSLQDVPARDRWLSWPHIPDRVRDNIREVEALLSRLEDIVKDGGQLQRLIEQVAERRAGQAVAS